MRRAPTAVALVASSLALGASASVPAMPTGSGSKVPTGPVSVRVVDCTGGATPEDRKVTFRGAMGQLPAGEIPPTGSERMSMRFVLEESGADGRYRKVKAPGLGTWRNSRPGVGRFVYRQRVLALDTGAIYRVTVRFRWHDTVGKVVASATQRSSRCRPGGRLPNLLMSGDVIMRPGAVAGTVDYVVPVTNDGHVPAVGVEVALKVDGAELDRILLPVLEAGERRELWFSGALVCKSVLEASVDPRAKVRESSELDNVRSTPCPVIAP